MPSSWSKPWHPESRACRMLTTASKCTTNYKDACDHQCLKASYRTHVDVQVQRGVCVLDGATYGEPSTAVLRPKYGRPIYIQFNDYRFTSTKPLTSSYLRARFGCRNGRLGLGQCEAVTMLPPLPRTRTTAEHMRPLQGRQW